MGFHPDASKTTMGIAQFDGSNAKDAL